MSADSTQLLTSILRDVSRSFYRTLRVLPSTIRPQISLAYLLARMTDTIADTELVPFEQRLGALQDFRARIRGVRSERLNLGNLAGQQTSLAERRLLENCETALERLEHLVPADRELLRSVLEIITSGQELDLVGFQRASTRNVIAFGTDEELDDYTYRVAGCVGEFWTRMCRAHVFPDAPLNESEMLAKGLWFGKGLQLVNVLRDMPRDLRQGRCYLPVEALRRFGLKPADLLESRNEGRLRPLFEKYLARAEEFLHHGWSYTNLVPRRCVRIRLACAWPVLIGLDTIKLLRRSEILGSAQPLKISRARVKELIGRTVLYYPWRTAWDSLGR